MTIITGPIPFKEGDPSLDAAHYVPPGLYRAMSPQLRLFHPRQDTPELPDYRKRTIMNDGDFVLVVSSLYLPPSVTSGAHGQYLYPVLFEDKQLFAIFFANEKPFSTLFKKVEIPSSDTPDDI